MPLNLLASGRKRERLKESEQDSLYKKKLSLVIYFARRLLTHFQLGEFESAGEYS